MFGWFIQKSILIVLVGPFSRRRYSSPFALRPSGKRDTLGCRYLPRCASDDALAWVRRRTRSRDKCGSDAQAWQPGRVAHLVQNMADDRRDAPGTGRPTALTGRRVGPANGMPRRMTKWRVLSPSAQLIIEPASGACAIIRDTCADGAYRFHWSVIPSEESLPIAAGRTGGLARARAIAEEALRAYAEDWLGLLGGRAEVASSNP
jgi:hypothetical protein